MILQFSFSFLLGLFLPIVYFKFSNKEIKIKGYHFHHTLYGSLSTISSIPLILKDIAGGIYLAGFGIGVITHHWITEKHIKLITKVN